MDALRSLPQGSSLSIHYSLFYRYYKNKSTPFAHFALYPYLPAVKLNKFLAEFEPKTRSFMFLGKESFNLLKWLEESLLVFE